MDKAAIENLERRVSALERKLEAVLQGQPRLPRSSVKYPDPKKEFTAKLAQAYKTEF
ncbi:MAG: hypothetical protein AB2745_08605 [Candidatus Thiodiazotropha endolucinida]